MNVESNKTKNRPPVVAIMGHIDHGKSTLLDYIRKTNVVAKEAGGITQHLSAYVVSVKDEHGENKDISFIDTPGHAAFQGMRERSVSAADIAILVVSAEDGVKAQTLEAWRTIENKKLPYIVAINKIDKENANIEKTKTTLLENGIYLEGMGGTVPVVAISAKQGKGVDELLSMILLLAELENFTYSEGKQAEGVVIEAHLDQKRGITGTLIVKDGVLKKGDFLVAGEAYAGTKIMVDFLGKPIEEVRAGYPVGIAGFSIVPESGTMFTSCNSKREAEECALMSKNKNIGEELENIDIDGIEETLFLPLIIRADVGGTKEAIEEAVKKIKLDRFRYKVISSTVGPITENDIRMATTDKNTIIVGFNVPIDGIAQGVNESAGVTIKQFDIIYKLTEFLEEFAEQMRPRVKVMEPVGELKVLKLFSQVKDDQVIGGRVTDGKIIKGAKTYIYRGGEEIGEGSLKELQVQKMKSSEAEKGEECGLMFQSSTKVTEGDILKQTKEILK